MNRFLTRAAPVALAAVFACSAFAQQGPAAQLGVSVKPAGGQNAQQQARDEGECYRQASRETGADPAKSARVARMDDAGARADGAASGAGESVRGAAAGELADADSADSDLGGATATGQPSREQVQRETLFKRAFAACLEARSYVVRY